MSLNHATSFTCFLQISLKRTTGSSMCDQVLAICVVKDVSICLDILTLEFWAIWEHPPSVFGVGSTKWPDGPLQSGVAHGKLTFQLWNSKESGIFQDAIPRLEISDNQSYHRENKFHQYDLTVHLHFGSVVQVLTNSSVLVSIHSLVALYFLECQVSILEKMMTNSLNCWRE